MCASLDELILDITQFVEINPTEVVVILLRADWSPVNADLSNINCKKQRQGSRVKSELQKIKNKDEEMSHYIEYVINGLGEDRVATDFHYRMRVRDLTLRGKNIVLLVNGELYP